MIDDTLVRELNVLRLEPGDTLVIHMARPLTVEMRDRIATTLRERLPDRVDVLVCDPDVSRLEVVRLAARHEAPA